MSFKDIANQISVVFLIYRMTEETQFPRFMFPQVMQRH